MRVFNVNFKLYTMKNIICILLTCVVISGTVGCKKYLDQVPDDRLTLEETFANQGTTFEFLSNIYRNIPNEYGQRNPGGSENAGLWTGATDEGEYLWGFVQSNDYNIGSWDANSGFVGDFWRNYYRGIRASGIFLANLREDATDMTPQVAREYRGEARALRAIFYFYLMRLYGPVVILGEDALPADASLDEIRLPRSTFDECTQYVVSQLELAMPDLADEFDNANKGRITKSMAMAYKAQVLFLNASPLFNGNTDLAGLKNTDGTNLVTQSVDVAKWTTAANAYRDFIQQYVPSKYSLYRVNNSNGDYDPYLSTRGAIIEPWNNEGIIVRPNSSIGARQYELTPYHNGFPSQVKGSGGLGATQNIVDAFFMANGKSIDDPASGYVNSGFSDYQLPYDDQPRSIYNQWVNREPRFYTNITFHGSTWLNRQYGPIVTEFNYSGNSGRSQGNDYTPTGYVVRKGMTIGPWDINDRPDILYRLGNVFLDYAEALNESDPANPDVLNYLNQIRNRAGIPEYGSADIPVPADQAAMREAIRKERRVELAFENVRFFDVRRWKIATQVDNGPVYGLNIGADMPDFLNVVAFETRVFSQRHYLFPIPQNDVQTNNLLVQNPGW